MFNNYIDNIFETSSKYLNEILSKKELSQLVKDLSDKKRALLLSQIGADCNFFDNPIPSIMTGVGNLIHPLDSNISNYLKGQKVLIYKPSFSISVEIPYFCAAFDKRAISKPIA